MWIVVVIHKFLSGTIKFVKLFCLKFFEIKLNIISKTIVLGIYSYILIKPIYNILIKDIMVKCLYFYIIGKVRHFRLTALRLYKRVVKMIKKSIIINDY